MNTIFRSVFVLLVLSLVIPFRGLSQDLSFEFADKPRLIECGGKPCFRLDLIAVDEEQRTVALGLGEIEDVSNFTVEESTREYQPFFIHFPEASNVSRMPRYSVLLIDLSGSMLRKLPGSDQTKFDAAKQAILEYVSGIEESVDFVAVAGFESHQVVENIHSTEFLTTKQELQNAVKALPTPVTKNNTALYSATHEALAVLAEKRDTGAEVSLVVLTDGRNDVQPQDDPGLLGDEGLEIVLQKSEETGIQIITIGFGAKGNTGSLDESTLRQLATSPSNYYFAGDAERLKEVFNIAREKFVNRFQLTVGPVRESKDALSGQSLTFQVSYASVSGEYLETRETSSWSAPPIGSPVYSGSLTDLEAETFFAVNTAVNDARWERRGIIFGSFLLGLALLWFAVPRFIWPQLYTKQKDTGDLDLSLRTPSQTTVPVIDQLRSQTPVQTTPLPVTKQPVVRKPEFQRDPQEGTVIQRTVRDPNEATVVSQPIKQVRARLTITKGLQKDLTYDLTSDKTVLGALSGTADFTVEDVSRQISRTHCIIRRVQNKWSIEDQSTNGTFVNGRRLTKGKPEIVKDGAIISLAEQIDLKFEIL